MINKSFYLSDQTALEEWAIQFSQILKAGDVVALNGDLGSGKSTLSRAIIRHLLNDKNAEVPSPTFSLVQIYDTNIGQIWHFDLYRLKQPRDVIELGLEEALGYGISIIEWPDIVAHYLPEEIYNINISFDEKNQNARNLTIVHQELKLIK